MAEHCINCARLDQLFERILRVPCSIYAGVALGVLYHPCSVLARGFEYLVRAATEGFLVRDDARVLLMVLYVREKQYEYALTMVDDLHGRYPENFLLHLNRVQILEKLDRHQEAAETLLEVVEASEAGVANYQKLDATQPYYPLGERLLALGERSKARAQFESAIAGDSTNARDRAYSILRVGEIFENAGQLEQARAKYLEVQALDDVDGSHRAASRRLRTLETR